MRVAIINTLYWPNKIGGAEVSVQTLAEGLANIGHEVHVLTLVELGSSRAGSQVSKNGVQIHYLPLHNCYWPFSPIDPGVLKKSIWHILDLYNPLMIKKVMETLTTVRPDLVHCNNVSGFSIGLFRALNKNKYKTVYTARDYYAAHHSTTKNYVQSSVNPLTRAYAKLRAYFLKDVNKITTISNYMAVDLNKLLPNKDISVIYNPIYHHYVESRSRPYLSKETISIGFLGRLTAEKGIEEFYKLAQALENKKLPQLMFTGGRGDKALISRLEGKYTKSVTNLGYIDKENFFDTIDLLVTPIIWEEPFGRTVAEALEKGVQVIGYGAGGAKEVHSLLDNLSNVANDFDDLTIKVTSFCLEKPKLQTKMSIEFTIDYHVSKMLDVYNNLDIAEL